MRRTSLSVCAVLALSGGVGSASAQTDVTFNNGSGGIWNDAGNWSPAVVPNNNGGTFNAILTALGGAYIVQLDIPVTIENFTMDESLATLDLTTQTLTVNQGFTADVGMITSSGGSGVITVAGETVFGDVILLNAGQVQSNGSLKIAPGTLMDICDTDVDYGGTGPQAATWEGNNTLSINSGGRFTNGSSSLMQISPDGDKEVSGDGSGSLTNDGELVLLSSPPPGSVLTGKVALPIGTGPRGGAARVGDVLRFDNSSFVNAGGVTVQRGELDLLEVVNDMTVDGELLLGRWTMRAPDGGLSIISFPSRDAVTNINTRVTLLGEGTFFPALDTLDTIGPEGRFEIGDLRDFAVQQSLLNLGEVVVGSTSLFDAQSGLGNITAAMPGTLVGGAFTVSGTFLSPSISPILELHKSRVRLIGPGSDFPALDTVQVIGTEAMLSFENGRSTLTDDDLALAQSGTLRVGMNSAVVVGGTLANIDNGVLRFGNYEIAGTVGGGLSPISVMEDCRLAMIGASSQMIDGAGTDVLSTLDLIGSNATLEVKGDKILVFEPYFQVDGTLTVDPSAAVNPVPGGAGGVMAGGAEVVVLGAMDINAGSTVEIGVRSGSVGGVGLVRADSVTFEGGGAGKLVCRFGIGIEEPAYPLSVHVVRSGSVAGQFATVEAIGLDPLFEMTVVYDAFGVKIGVDWVCQADLNGDGILDNGDIGEFVTMFLAGDMRADFNGDGILDNGDIGEFVNQFLAGC